MGWSSGARLFEEIIVVAKKHIPDDTVRKAAYKELIAAFEDFDCDTLNECLGKDKVFDEAFGEMYPDYFEDE